MAADLHIHVLTKKFDKRHYAAFQSNVLGSKFFRLGYDEIFESKMGYERFHLSAMASDTPNVWVGEVSWLKAALFEDERHYIPSAVSEIHSIIGEHFPVIDESLISKVKEAMLLNRGASSYSVNSAESVEAFLRDHIGEKAFTISW